MAAKTYTIVVKQKGKPDTIRHGVDELNSIIIVSEMKMAWPKLVESGQIQIERILEKR